MITIYLRKNGEFAADNEKFVCRADSTIFDLLCFIQRGHGTSPAEPMVPEETTFYVRNFTDPNDFQILGRVIRVHDRFNQHPDFFPLNQHVDLFAMIPNRVTDTGLMFQRLRNEDGTFAQLSKSLANDDVNADSVYQNDSTLRESFVNIPLEQLVMVRYPNDRLFVVNRQTLEHCLQQRQHLGRIYYRFLPGIESHLFTEFVHGRREESMAGAAVRTAMLRELRTVADEPLPKIDSNTLQISGSDIEPGTEEDEEIEDEEEEDESLFQRLFSVNVEIAAARGDYDSFILRATEAARLTNYSFADRSLLESIMIGGNPRIMRFFMDHIDLRFNFFFETNQTLLLDAICKGFPRLAMELMDVCNVNHEDNRGKTALIHAAERGYLEVVQALLERRCSTTVRPPNEKTAEQTARDRGFDDVADAIHDWNLQHSRRRSRRQAGLDPVE